MKIEPIHIKDSERLEAIRSQLKLENLPCEDIGEKNQLVHGYYLDKELVGTGAVELHGDFGLLRSISVVARHRGNKYGERIVFHLIAKAKSENLKGLYLLTETAENFFSKIGFFVIDRASADGEIQLSSEFTHACPTSAICMYLEFNSSLPC